MECGVGNDFLSSAILEYLPWNELNKHFYLFDKFNGLDERYLTPEEIKRIGSVESHNRKRLEGFIYCKDYQSVKSNFRELDRIQWIKGAIPDTLKTIPIGKVCYLNIDMNCVIPEIAAIEYFFPRLSRGAIMLLDDYAYMGCHEQKRAMDAWAAREDAEILSLSTGQGMLLKA